jgi:hypothetical protein
MIRIATLLALSALAAAPAMAANYSAKPANQTAGRIVDRNTVWACGAGTCTASNSDARPAIVCQVLARKVGRLESFAANGQPFASAELDRCNAGAKGGSATAAASSSN